jgi:acyl-CoA-binding protein
MSLKDTFEAAQARAKSLATKPSNDDLLALYSLYKQATDGDVKGERPSGFDFVGAAKFDAWEKRRGMSAEQAMQAYVALVDRLAGS